MASVLGARGHGGVSRPVIVWGCCWRSPPWAREHIRKQLLALNLAVEELGVQAKLIIWGFTRLALPRVDGEHSPLGMCKDKKSIVIRVQPGWQVTAAHELVHAYTSLEEEAVELMTTILRVRLACRNLHGAEKWMDP